MTLRVLKQMAEARQRESWEHTSWLLAKLHNVHCRRTSDMVDAADMNPMYQGPRRSGGAQELDADFNAAMCDALSAAEAKEAK